MKKVINIHFKGFSFQFEEDAYNALTSYLAEIGRYLGNIEGKDEIMDDIQARISELLHNKFKNGQLVFTMKDVDEIKARLGEPCDFAEDAGEEEPTFRRKFFCDPREQWIGGVCTGLSTYFKVDVIWFRVAFVLLGFAGSLGVLMYLALWIIVPKAKTTSDFLEMEGKAPTIENMKSAFSGKNPEMEDLKNKFHDWRNSPSAKKFGNNARGVLNAGGEGLRKILSILGKVIGVAFVIGAGLTLISWVAALLGMGGIWSMAPFHEADWITTSSFPHPLWPDTDFPIFATITIIILFSCPLLAILYGGLRLLNNKKFKTPGVTPFLAILFAAGIGMGIYSALDFGKHFSHSAHTETNIPLQFNSDTIYLHGTTNIEVTIKGNNHNLNFFQSIGVLENDIVARSIELRIEPSRMDSSYLVLDQSALGENRKEALNRAQNISTDIQFEENSMIVLNTIQYPREDQIRGQFVKATLYLGTGKTVFLDASIRPIIYDIKNTTNTHDRKMINKFWTMIPAGLACLNCNPQEI